LFTKEEKKMSENVDCEVTGKVEFLVSPDGKNVAMTSDEKARDMTGCLFMVDLTSGGLFLDGVVRLEYTDAAITRARKFRDELLSPVT
jgi:hypothetical protein